MEALRGKLHLAETSAKSFEALASERAHQISSLERECKVREERLAAVEEALSNKDAKIGQVETKMAATVEKLSALQVEKERLIQQVRSHTLYWSIPSCPVPFLSHSRLSLGSTSCRSRVQQWHRLRAGLTPCCSQCVGTSTR